MRLSASETRRAGLIARAILPPGTLGGVVDDLDAGALLAADCAASPWHATLLLKIALRIVWWAPLFVLRRARTFGGLDAPQRERVLEALLKSPLYLVRSTTLYMKLASCSMLLGDKRVLDRVGAYSAPRPVALRHGNAA